LESRRVLAGHPIITEFVASNSSGLQDGFAEDSDWIEIRNDADVAVDLIGYHLTDDPQDLNQWEFTSSTVLAPGEYLIVFASARDVIDPAGHPHTNFQLEKNGEYLALTTPDLAVLSEFGTSVADYPPQVKNLSYGVAGVELVGPESVSEYLIPNDGQLGATWITNSFDAAANGFSLGRAAIGYENNTGSPTSYSPSILTEVPSGTTNVYQRIEFAIDSAAQVLDLELELLYDDGVVVYLNGTAVASENAPEPLGYNTPASADHPDVLTLAGSTYDLDRYVSLLVDGKNTLAIHALNRPGSSDFLLVPRLRSQSISGDTGYLSEPTPGGPNARELDLGPLITQVTASSTLAEAGKALTITAEVADFTSPLDPTTIGLHYRVMYGDEFMLAMVDDGSGGDSVAGDGVFSAQIPASAFAAGQMVRWRITATDTIGIETREPRFLDALDSPEYFGTVVDDSAITTDLPVMQWFVENPSAASTTAGTRGSLFLGGEFYDNIQTDSHGQSTRGAAFPKKSFDFDSNSGIKFRIRPDLNRVSDFNLLTNYADQTKLRHTLMYDLFAQADYAHHFAFPVMVYRNGGFYGLFDVVEEGDSEYLDRLGLDPDNPLYKVNNRLDDAYTNVEKKSREYENHTDFQEVVDAAQTLTGDAAITWDFDHLEIADLVNYLAIHNVGSSSDFGHKNMYWFRDSSGTGLWSVLPWDQDLSLGHQWDASVSPPYFKDDLVTDLSVFRGGNKLFQRLYADPVFREMYTRRVRSLADQFYGLAGSAAEESYLGKNIRRWEALIADEAVQDADRWGIQANFTHTPAQAADQLLDEFIPLRRAYLDGLAVVPSSQIGTPTILFDDVDYDADPLSGLQTEEYVRLNNPNDVAVDISGWRLDGGIGHRFKGGTVLPAGGSLYVVKDVLAFQSRSTGPSSGQQLLIQGNYSGQLTFSGETVNLIASDGTLVDTLETPEGLPTVNQKFLRVTEVHYHPIVDDTEFIEFTNISSGGVATTLDLSGVAIIDGPNQPFVFPADTVLQAGGKLLVVQDRDAFLAAYPTVDATMVAGVYLGGLNNSGERIKVVDSGTESILDLVYGDSDPWPISADGAGASLVSIDPIGTPFARLSKPYSWRGSAEAGGTPGTTEAGLRGVVINELLTHTDEPLRDTIELFNPTSAEVDLGGWYLSDSKQDLLKFQIPLGTRIAAGGYLTFDESQFNPTPSSPGPNDFALSGSQGEEVWLTIPDAAGTSVGEFVDQIAIGATLNGQTFGRLPEGKGRLVPLDRESLSAANGTHQVGDLVISEIHYHPLQPSAAVLAIAPTIRSGDLEFVELHNHRSFAVDLTNWRLRGDVDFDFPPATTIASGETLVLISFDPADPQNADRVDGFRAHFGINSSVALAGPFSASLGNSYGRVELEHPDAAPVDDPTVMPRVTLDEVFYDDLAPWPIEADGSGESLQRVAEFAYGNAAESWVAAEPTPGTTRYQPRVTGIKMNAGQPGRSIVTSIEIAFDRTVEVDAASFEILRRGDQQSVGGLVVDTTTVAAGTVATLTFGAGPLVRSHGSAFALVDGDYQLRVIATETSSKVGGALMVADHYRGAAETDAFFSLFGDSDGDRDVDAEDFGRFGRSFLKSRGDTGFEGAFDFDGDDDVDGTDYAQFGRRYLKSVPFG
jgi:hypothetical protein